MDTSLPPLESSEDPWGSEQPPSKSDFNMGDWADFSSASFVANFDNNFEKSTGGDTALKNTPAERDVKDANVIPERNDVKEVDKAIVENDLKVRFERISSVKMFCIPNRGLKNWAKTCFQLVLYF